MSRAIPLLPLWAFVACYRVNFKFDYYYYYSEIPHVLHSSYSVLNRKPLPILYNYPKELTLCTHAFAPRRVAYSRNTVESITHRAVGLSCICGLACVAKRGRRRESPYLPACGVKRETGMGIRQEKLWQDYKNS